MSLAVVAVAILVAALPDYRARVLVAAVLWGIAAGATDLPTGCCGVPVFGAAFPFAIGAYGAAVLAHDGRNLLTALVVSAAIAGVIAFGVAWTAFRMRLVPLQFGLITLLLSLGTEQVITVSSGLLGGSNGLSGIRPPIIFAGRHLVMTVLVAGALLLLVTWLRDSAFGLLMRGTRDDAGRVEALGQSSVLVRSVAVLAAAVVASAAGVFYASVAGVAFPAMFGLTANLLVLVWIALGKSGSVVGPVLSTVVYRLVENELGSQLENQYLLLLGFFIFTGSILLASNGLRRRRGYQAL